MIEKTFGRPPQAAQAEPSPRAPHAALLVDFDNVTMGIRSDLQTQLRKLLNSDIIRGKVSVQRAYADWRRYPQYIVPLTEASIDLIFAPAVGANKKNATDIRLAIDALELVFTRPEIGTFILLSGDSDFSALVLKLKEYGKFVIGVGIRESSSDLLVQNCDEYYSYSELTGLARAGDEEIVRRDPWELVVEAVQKMQKGGDVMRSDRLKQVMQSIDPNFDEKDAGCNRFSKFVVEAEQRGLLRLAKMENGQYAVDLGSNANVPVEDGTAAQASPASSAPAAAAQGKKHSQRTRGDRETKQRYLTLSEGFDLLKRALIDLGAAGDEATVAEKACDGMIALHGNDADPLFEAKRFQRMLRQAHDADVIELIKSDGDDYMLKLSAAAVAEIEAAKEGAEEEGGEQEVRAAEAEGAEEAGEPKKTTKRKTVRKATTRKSPRSRARAAAKDGAEEKETSDVAAGAGEAGEAAKQAKKATKRKTVKKKTTRTKKDEKETAEGAAEQAEATEEVGKPTTATKRKTAKKRTTRTERAGEGADEKAPEAAGAAEVAEEPKVEVPIVNPRFRRGGRSSKPRLAAAEKPAETDANQEPPPAPTLSPKAASGPRTLGMRSGSRAAKLARKRADSEESQKQVEPSQPADESAYAGPEPASPVPEAAVKLEQVLEPEPSTRDAPPNEPEEEGAGLFRRVTAAFQRAMGAVKENDER